MKISHLQENLTPASAPTASVPGPKFGRSDEMLESGASTTTAGVMSTGTPTNMGIQRRSKKGSDLLKGIKTSEKYANSRKAGISEDTINEDDLSEEQLQAKKRREELFKRSKDREIGNKPSDREIMAKEEFDGGGEYNDEIDMVQNNLHTIVRVSTNLGKELQANENMPEWVQEKIAVAKSMIVTVMDYMISQHERGNVYTQDMDEVAPPGAKAERMVKHIKAGYAKDGNLTPKEKSIAFATAWKAHNKGKVKEQGVAEAGDTAKGQKQLAKVHQRAADRVTSKQADKDPAYARKAQQTQDRAWDRLAVKEQGVAEGWKEKVAGGALAIGALGGIGALQNVAPNVTVQGHTARLAIGNVPENAKLVTTDDGKKVYVWSVRGSNPKSAGSHQELVYKPAEVKEQGVAEGDKKPHPKTWHDVDPKLGKQVDKMTQAEKVKKGLAHPDTLKKAKEQGVAEGTGDDFYAMALQKYPQLKRVDRAKVIDALNNAYEDYLMHYGYEGIGPDEESSMIDYAVKGLRKNVDEESKGLWANIHAKRERIKHGSGEHMRKPGSKGAPTADALRKSAK